MKKIKILPLLVFVAMMAFSVRLVEVVSGVSSLSGSAYAETKAEEHEDEKSAEENAGGVMFSDDEAEMEVAAATEEKPAEKPVVKAEEEQIEWRDPKDEDPSYDIVKGQLFDEMAQRRKELDMREQKLQTREALLQAAEQELDRKFQELSQLRKEIEALLVTQSDEEQARVASLVKIYEGMKPKDAARIFDTLDLDILVSVVSSMSERKLSPILAAMNPERARTITIMLAEQKQLPSLPSTE